MGNKEDIKKILKEKLIKYAKHKKRITLDEMQGWMSGDTAYEVFANEVIALSQEGVLKPRENLKTNGKRIPLYNGYTIIKEKLTYDLVSQIQEFQRQAHSAIHLESYLKLDESVWQEDIHALRNIDHYLKRKGVPKDEATMPERSYEITGDEKWIELHGGKKVLDRLNLWQTMKIASSADPVMLAINKEQLFKKGTRDNPHCHLIVENKSIYYLLVNLLKKTELTSICYGCGWKITAGFDGMVKQLDLEAEENLFYYFGDLDYEGLAIYKYLGDKVKPAMRFYRALIALEPSKGKENQKVRKETLEQFVKHFDDQEADKIRRLLQEGFYYPQEALTKEMCLKCLQIEEKA